MLQHFFRPVFGGFGSSYINFFDVFSGIRQHSADVWLHFNHTPGDGKDLFLILQALSKIMCWA